jgi:hypothetical protein
MKEAYVFNYSNENEFKKLERSLKKYNMLAYKKLYFEYYISLKEGNFLGEVIAKDDVNGIFTYELKLPTDTMFSKVHGFLRLIYRVNEKDQVIILDRLEPISILSEGHQSELETYKGVMVSKSHSDKDMFKIHLLNMIQK